MNPKNTKDPRSPDRHQWIAEARKVKPIVLDPPQVVAKKNLQARSGQSLAGLETYSGTWQHPQVRHLLSRTLFGLKKAELDFFSQLSMEESVDHLLRALPLPAPPVNDYEGIGPGAQDPHVGLGESWLNAPHGGEKETFRVISLKSWMIKNILEQPANIRQKMVLFWSNLLVTKLWDVYIAKTSYRYLEMLHLSALGNYKKLIKDFTLDPSVLIFLNGASNTKAAPDENFGRELQELFCIGKGPDAKFTEGDVQAAARVLTGWTIDWSKYENSGPFTSLFNQWGHDFADKQFSSFYNNRVIKGKPGENGAEELDELLDMIVDHPETARYICRRLYAFFVANEITEVVEEQIIRPLADLFQSSGFEIQPVMEKLLKSAHFYDQLHQGALIKSPADHLLGIWRTLGVDFNNDNDLLKTYEGHQSMLWHMAGQGMEMGDPPNVAGWAAYYQAPQYDKAWITTDTITKRALSTDSLLYWGFWISPERNVNLNILGFTASLSAPQNPNVLLQESALLLLGLELAPEVLGDLKSILLSGQLQDHYWTDAWIDYQNNPTNSSLQQIVRSRLQACFRQLLQLGEYHLM